MSDRPILAPVCPACEAPPLLGWLLPYFCSNDECRVLSWDPFDDPATFKAKVVRIDLSSLEDL